MERNYGYAVARAYAGHAGQGAGGELGTTFTYVKATLGEVPAALEALTGEPHPLADMTGDDDTTQATYRSKIAFMAGVFRDWRRPP